jgi:hypothetical protein
MEPQDAARGEARAETSQPKAANDRDSAAKLVQSATPERNARTLAEARDNAQAFVRKPIRNIATGFVGTVSGNNLSKMTNTKAVEKSVSPTSHALAVANADKLFENAILDRSHADRDGEATIAAIHRYVAPMLMPDGEVLVVKLTVKETTGPNEPNPIYSIETIDVEKPASVLSPSNEGFARVMDKSTHPTSGLSSNVVALVEKVKRAARIGCD